MTMVSPKFSNIEPPFKSPSVLREPSPQGSEKLKKLAKSKKDAKVQKLKMLEEQNYLESLQRIKNKNQIYREKAQYFSSIKMDFID